MRFVAASLTIASTVVLAACVAQPPEGPSFAAMPGPGKTFDQFQADNGRCQQAAAQATGPVTPGQAATQSAVGSAAVGTAVGAAAGALVGAAAGAPGAGAAIGAGTGLLVGSASGAAQVSADNLQRTYDVTYAQCMSAAGESVSNPSTLPSGYPPDAYPAYGYAPPGYVYTYPPPYYYYYGPPVVIDGRWGWGWRGHWHR